MNIEQHLDSTYLKLADQANISADETQQKVVDLVNECIAHNFKLAMIRSEYIEMAQKMIADADGATVVGTVIGFHEGTYTTEEKLAEAQVAIDRGVDELDYVINYEAFKEGKINLVKAEVFKGTKIALDNDKICKWIIEIAALTNEEIVDISALIRDVVLENFGPEKAPYVFVKSSTGFFKAAEGKPVGATFEGMKLIVENSKPLQAKAAGGVKSFEDAVKMVDMGVSRIGTSSALAIASGKPTEGGY